MSKRELLSEVQHQRLEAQVTDLTAKNAELTAKNEDLTAEVETLTADNEKQAGSIKTNLASINTLTVRVKELEDVGELARVQELLKNTEAERDELRETCLLVDGQRRQIATLKREKGEAIDVHNGALATITRLQDTIALLEAQLADGTNADAANLQTIANLSEDVSVAQLDVRVYRIAVRDYAKRLSHMRDARDAAVKERDAARDTAKALHAQLATLEE